MIKEVHKVVSDYTEWDDKYIVYYVSGCKKEYLGYNLPKSVERFIDDEDTEAMHVHPGGYTRFFRR